MLKRCLLIDSDADARAQLATYLQGFEFKVATGGTGAALRAQMAHQRFDVLLMDLALPDEDGLQSCRWVQQAHRVPLIAFSQGGGAISRVQGLEHGADDVVERPCELRELVAHVRALLRRVSAVRSQADQAAAPMPTATRLQIGGWQLLLEAHRLVAFDGTEQVLDADEFSVLHALAQRPREVLQRAVLAAALPAVDGAGRLRRLEQAIASLRRKLHDTPPACRLILTVRNAGYVLHAEVRTR